MYKLVSKKDFPIFSGRTSKINYLDSAATSQKPQSVVGAEAKWYAKHNANIHRGAYRLAEEATELHEGARVKVAKFIGAKDARSIVFTSGTTESINLVASAWAKHNLKRGDVILLTEMEHHANIVPWQLLAQERGFKIKYWPITTEGELDMSDLARLFSGVKFLSLTHVSNVLGTVNPLKRIIAAAKRSQIRVLIDAAQSVGHMPINVNDFGADFLAFSAHKMLGPTGIGVLYVKPELFAQMRPYQSGGEMISEVSYSGAKFKQMPWLLEAGTQPLAQAFALAAAIDYLGKIGMARVLEHSAALTAYAYGRLAAIDGVKIFGPAANKRLGLVSFTVAGLHAHDLATLLDRKGICIRAGHHCAMPLHGKLKVSATARFSFGIYNDKADIDLAVDAVQSIIKKWNRPTKKRS